MDLSHSIPEKKVYYLTPENTAFSKFYLAAREKEQRLLTDAQVIKLPHIDLYEWKLRKKSTMRFVNYIANKNRGLTILDIGCGNGWFSNKIATISKKNEVIGLDVNRVELEQAARIFNKKNLKFVYADLFKVFDQFESQFDIITLNGTIQYFENFTVLIGLLVSYLKPKGEIHLIDSPFYEASEIPLAKQRTKKYYNDLGLPEMAEQYYHHNIDLTKDFQLLYKYKRNLFHAILGKKDSPYSWLCLIKK
ncbi:class I SAM-dependent methyltransferase [Lacinutrix neustonica]|uniref:Class I SAM-dependent methyltransferase n=1 Tax=Lacinutrix neustonica TaxID=2980107 RepID=A0A9E8MY98_9FLAO|nr:class I SAM-dependent methyltransferase [Lacinutrix neustonica]WAC03773.1 class I SAM-dependent methyltransferase [Lacinutrix neustonica]